MPRSLRDRLRKILLDRKILSKEELDKVLDIQKKKGGNLGEILKKKGLVSEARLLSILSEELAVPPIILSKYRIEPDIVKLVPEKMARRYNIIPVSKMGKTLTLAMADPLNIFAIDDIRSLTKYQIQPVIATADDIQSALNNYYREEAAGIREILEEAKKPEEVFEVVEEEKFDIHAVAEESRKAPIVKMVDLVLTEALKRRASDIHIEPQKDSLRIRYRIDGALRDFLSLPKKNQNAVLARLKIMSGLDITESRLPQDGRFKVRLEEKEIDFRVSVLPIAFGGKVVLRALDKSNLSIGLGKLGFLPEPLKLFKEAIKASHGMILVTGPTGSGKSTTLYSILQQLNTPEKNIITIEDPVEYQIEGITQVQIRPEVGLTFANGLRSLLRQAPDIIMIGEIRDFETADIAVKASLTGQLVFSTLHTNDAPGAISRLIDMGVEPFLIASSCVLLAAQRLCRKICQSCKESYHIPKPVLDRVGLKVDPETNFYRGKGCPKCNNTGYYGRIGTLEALVIDDRIRDMIIKRASTDEIKNYAAAHGFKTLRDNAMQKCVDGLTTLEEVLRITSEE